MSTFTQFHVITSYPPSNLNRDDLGRNKTAMMGGAQRSRVSSQCQKRAVRLSEGFADIFNANIGVRTKKMGVNVFDQLVAGGISEKNARNWARDIAGVFGKLPDVKKDDLNPGLDISQLAHISVTEQAAIDELVKLLIAEQRGPEPGELELLRHETESVDIALFGRMMASNPGFNVEASCQFAHSISVHEARPEIDYFTANDDLNDGSEHSGSSHIGENSFVAAVYYTYICVNNDLLISNLNGNVELANRAVRALIEGVITVSPTGKQNSFGSRAHASYVLAERGNYSPCAIGHAAFTKPIDKKSSDYMAAAISALEEYRANHSHCYDVYTNDSYTMNVTNGTGRLSELLTFVSE